MRQKASQSNRIAPIFVDEALASGQAAGIDTHALIEGLGLRQSDLAALTPAEFARVWLDLSIRMEDEFFGLGKRPMRPGSTTLMGHAVRGAPTLGVGIRRLLRFLNITLDEPYGLFTVSGSHCAIRLHETGPVRSAFAYRTFFLILHGFTCWMAREPIPLARVDFPCDEPHGKRLWHLLRRASYVQSPGRRAGV